MTSLGRPVLIADDDTDIRGLMAAAVHRSGNHVCGEAVNGSHALETAASHQPHLAILDVSMPELSGLQVCRALRSDPATAGIKVVLVSAAAQPTDIAEGLAAGAEHYVIKPFSPRQLAVIVSSLLNNPA